MVTKWVPLQSVLDTVQDTLPGNFWNENIVLEHASRAMEMINVRSQYQDDIKHVQVVNHKAKLPKGLLQINQIAYKTNFCLTTEDRAAIEEALGTNNEPYMTGSTLWLHSTWLESPYYKTYWKPLRLSTNTFALAVHCENCVNIGAECGENYTVTPDGTITTSFKEGYLCISYTRYPMDCDDNFLIPDNEYYKEAIRTYIMMRIWEFRMNLKEEGADRLYLMYRDQWSLMKAKAIASIEMPTIDEMENIRNIHNRLVPRFRRYYGFFGNLASEEKQAHS